MPQLNTGQSFPPKFKKGVIYPAIYDLDMMDMDGAPVGDVGSGVYFNLSFTGQEQEGVPTLTYGKHQFTLTHTTAPVGYDEDGGQNYDDPYPPLKSKSRILFEVKDANDLVIYSDIIPGHALTANNGFKAYIWLKVDPLRTYDYITEGTGKITIVGETIVNFNQRNWKGKYNVRTTFPIDIRLFTTEVNQDTDEEETYPNPNRSPVFMKNTKVQMGSGSGLFISHSMIGDDASGAQNHYLALSASKLETYGGRLKSISIEAKRKYQGTFQEVITDWDTIDANFNFPEISDIYENFIDKDYSEGLNPISFDTGNELILMETPRDIPVNHQIKFRIKFKSAESPPQVVKDPLNMENDFELLYPSGSDNDPNSWMDFITTEQRSATSQGYRHSDRELARTTDGNFIFNKAHFSVARNAGGQVGDTAGNLTNYKGKGPDDDPFRDGGSGGDQPS